MQWLPDDAQQFFRKMSRSVNLRDPVAVLEKDSLVVAIMP